MTWVPFAELPDSARLWVFGTDRPVHPAEAERILSAVDRFLSEWSAHGVPLRGARDWRLGRFLLVAVDEDAAPPSGCSIDALVRVLKSLETELELVLVDNAPVWYLDGERVERVTRAEFRTLARSGELESDVKVFDNSITRLAALRRDQWLRPARESWHGRAFFGDRRPA